MDFLRKIVSGPKNRYQKNGYNLDLTYVTDRIIGMSFPAEGFEKLYRNSLDQVAKFIRDEHGEKYLIFNLSCRTYNYEKFGEDKIISYQWEDHHSPPLHMLFDICQKMHNFLLADKENVVFVHCKAGKGRTGTVICSYLLYSGRFSNPSDALQYYGRKRFYKDGLGVNQPCQQRYVRDYFWQILKRKLKNKIPIYPMVKQIKQILLRSRPQFSDEGCKPYFEVYDVATQKLLMTTKKNNKDQKRFEVGENEFTCVFDKNSLDGGANVLLHGDVLIKMIDNCKWSKDTVMGRIAFNTTFIMADKLIFNKSEVSPSQVKDDKRYPEDFLWVVEFQDKICKDTFETPFDELCPGICQQQWDKDKSGKENWQSIFKILDKYEKPDPELSKMLLFGDKEDDVEKILYTQQNAIFQRNESESTDQYSPNPSERYLIERQKQEKQLQKSGLQVQKVQEFDIENNYNINNNNNTNNIINNNNNHHPHHGQIREKASYSVSQYTNGSNLKKQQQQQYDDKQCQDTEEEYKPPEDMVKPRTRSQAVIHSSFKEQLDEDEKKTQLEKLQSYEDYSDMENLELLSQMPSMKKTHTFVLIENTTQAVNYTQDMMSEDILDQKVTTQQQQLQEEEQKQEDTLDK